MNSIRYILLSFLILGAFTFGQLPAPPKEEINKKINSSKSDNFAEAMKAIEKVRKADLKTEILRIDKKIATSRLHKDLRESVSDATGRLDDKALEKIKSKIRSAESLAKELLNEKVTSSQQEIEGSEKSKSANLNKPDTLPSPPVLEEPENKYENKPRNLSANRFPERVRVLDDGENHTVIDADGRLIFDGSSSLGDDYQVVIFEDNVTVSHPGFVMNSDRLEARFKKTIVDSELQKKPLEDERRQLGSGRLEVAEATGKEVVITRKIDNNQNQVAKAGKVTFHAQDFNDPKSSDKIILEIFPSVQKGQSRVIAKSIGTRIILIGDEMIVEGPVRTQIVGAGLSESEELDNETGSFIPKDKNRETIIDAEHGAVFNRLSSDGNKRELIFEGDVSVVDSDFNLFSDKLTAFVHPFSKTGLIEKAVAVGGDQNPAQIEHISKGGKLNQGKAGIITFLGSTGDIIMDNWPEIRREEHSSIAKYRDAQIILKRDGSVNSRGVDTRIVRELKKP